MSGDRYLIRDQEAIYFLTFTVIDWVDIFSRKEYRFILTDSLNHCIAHKGLTVFAWVIMTNHMHLIVKAGKGNNLSSIIRDYKKFTAKTIISRMHEIAESRREWLLNKLRYAGNRLTRITNYKFWKDDNHAIVLDSTELMEQKINYIHNNPVVDMIVEEAEQYIFSSAKDYCGVRGLVNIEQLS
ncbi:MAG TPA: transposase [Flavobacteriales bacterium]|nr:transposase [Flavobacteriales bacterium]